MLLVLTFFSYHLLFAVYRFVELRTSNGEYSSNLTHVISSGLAKHKSRVLSPPRLEVTEGHWKRHHAINHDLLLVDLFDVEY